jgi:hypothetical protein
MSKLYAGYPYQTDQGGFTVLVIDPFGFMAKPVRPVARLLDPAPSQALVNHSPDGFAWGYGGSGPAQLALALLLDATGNPDVALAYYQKFKGEVVAGWPVDRPWTYDQDQLLAWIGLRCARISRGGAAWPWQAPDPLPRSPTDASQRFDPEEFLPGGGPDV